MGELDINFYTFAKAGIIEPCETPTLWVVMIGEGVAYCTSSMRNGV